MFRKIQLKLTPAQRMVRAAQRREYLESPSVRHWQDYEPAAPARLDFHEDARVDWSLLDADDRFAGGDY